jgi:hypothetical protein
MNDTRLSVVIRFHDPGQMSSLDLALFSLLNQGYDEIEVLICCQALSPEAFAAVEDLARGQILPPGAVIRCINVPAPPGDQRSLVANAGIAAATGRYISFLDYDDLVYPQGYPYLIRRLRADASAVAAFGAFNMAIADGRGPDAYFKNKLRRPLAPKLSFFENNLYQMHCGVIDRARVAPDILAFEDGRVLGEDYQFLLKVLGSGRWLDVRDTVVVGEYQLRRDDSNTVVSGTVVDPAKAAEWHAFERWIATVRDGASATLNVRELVEYVAAVRAEATRAAVAAAPPPPPAPPAPVRTGISGRRIRRIFRGQQKRRKELRLLKRLRRPTRVRWYRPSTWFDRG